MRLHSKLQAEQDATDIQRTKMKGGMKDKFNKMKRKWDESEQLVRLAGLMRF